MNPNLVIDYGTSSCRASLTDNQGRILRSSREPVKVHLDGLKAEVDLEEAWSACVKAVRRVLGRLEGTEAADDPISAVPAVIGIGGLFGYVFLDERERPLGRAVIWMDGRAAAQVRSLESDLGADRIHRITGRMASTELLGPLLMWFRQHEADRFGKIRRIIGFKDELVRRLTGAIGTDFAHMNYTLAWNPREHCLDAELLDYLDCSASLFPPVSYPWEPAGSLAASAAARFGLPAGVPVITGTSDGTAAMYGGGIAREGSSVLVSGTTDVLMTLTRSPELAADSRLSINTGMIPGTWAVGAAMGLSGGAVNYWGNLLEGDLSELITRAAELPPLGGGVSSLPGLAGERAPYWEMGMRGGLTGLAPDHGAAHILRAVMEGTTYRIRTLLEQMRQARVDVGYLHLVGGGAASPGWNQIRSDILGLPVFRLEEPEATTMGTALFCSCAALNEELGQLTESWIRIRDEYHPSAEKAELYRHGYERFLHYLELTREFTRHQNSKELTNGEY